MLKNGRAHAEVIVIDYIHGIASVMASEISAIFAWWSLGPSPARIGLRDGPIRSIPRESNGRIITKAGICCR